MLRLLLEVHRFVRIGIAWIGQTLKARIVRLRELGVPTLITILVEVYKLVFRSHY